MLDVVGLALKVTVSVGLTLKVGEMEKVGLMVPLKVMVGEALKVGESE